MTAMSIFLVVLVLLAALVAVSLLWRWASAKRSVPFPWYLAWMLDNPINQRLSGQRTTLQRMGLRPGKKILEMGPGPGRLLIPAAQWIMPGGEAVGIDVQPRMIERLRARAAREGLTNLTAIVGDASQPHVPEASFDVVFLCTALGEIPDRAGALAQAYRALKPGGLLSITEMFGDPHYQSRSTVQRLAEAAGFRLQSIQGSWWFFTANFLKP
jgi:ubiquinone/menaquinone biosynthesis C-methylase UbiE